MNPYTMLGSGFGTTEAASLSARLSTWHDAMVAHERRLRAGTASDLCDDECPHVEARALWSEAVATFGPRAHDLRFLRSRANETVHHSTRIGGAAREPLPADKGDQSGRTRAAQGRRRVTTSSEAARTAAEL
jgi:hypothetical protein